MTMFSNDSVPSFSNLGTEKRREYSQGCVREEMSAYKYTHSPLNKEDRVLQKTFQMYADLHERSQM